MARSNTPWFRFYADTINHPKLHDLAAALGEEVVTTAGRIAHLWAFVVRFAPDGNLVDHSRARVARAMHWQPDSDVLINLLIDLRWLDMSADGSLSVHRWMENGADCYKEAQRKKAARLAVKQRKAQIKASADSPCEKRRKTKTFPTATPPPAPPAAAAGKRGGQGKMASPSTTPDRKPPEVARTTTSNLDHGAIAEQELVDALRKDRATLLAENVAMNRLVDELEAASDWQIPTCSTKLSNLIDFATGKPIYGPRLSPTADAPANTAAPDSLQQASTKEGTTMYDQGTETAHAQDSSPEASCPGHVATLGEFAKYIQRIFPYDISSMQRTHVIGDIKHILALAGPLPMSMMDEVYTRLREDCRMNKSLSLGMGMFLSRLKGVLNDRAAQAMDAQNDAPVEAVPEEEPLFLCSDGVVRQRHRVDFMQDYDPTLTFEVYDYEKHGEFDRLGRIQIRANE